MATHVCTHTHWTLPCATDLSCIYGSHGHHDNMTHGGLNFLSGGCPPTHSHKDTKFVTQTCSHPTWHGGQCKMFGSAITAVCVVSKTTCMCFLWLRKNHLSLPWGSISPRLASGTSVSCSPPPLHFLLVSLAQPPPLSGGVCKIQLVCVMLGCLLLLSNGCSGQESSWKLRHVPTHTGTRSKESPGDSLFILVISILPVAQRTETGGVGGTLCCFTPKLHPTALGWISHWWPVAWFQDHQTRKYQGRECEKSTYIISGYK